MLQLYQGYITFRSCINVNSHHFRIGTMVFIEGFAKATRPRGLPTPHTPSARRLRVTVINSGGGFFFSWRYVLVKRHAGPETLPREKILLCFDSGSLPWN